MYYRLASDIYATYGIADNPLLPPRTSFLAGRVISSSPLASPLVFETNYPEGERPRHFLGDSIPVASDLFVQTLRTAGADNFQVFPAVLHNQKTGDNWGGYHAFNVVGLVDAADSRSKYEVIMPGSDAEVPALVDFVELAFGKDKAGDLRMFRLLQNPTLLFVSEQVKQWISQHRPPEGWGITTFEVPVY